jgi:endonuclease YncB( thermonuclease family)
MTLSSPNARFPFSVAACLLAILIALPATAQEMPAPRKMPRIPVNSQQLPGSKAPPTSRIVEGQAIIVDGEKLRIGDVDLRLFGVIPPQLSASFGPQARSTLDSLVSGQNVNCQIRDRDHDGRFLATCHTVTTNADLAYELLRRGLAVTARGSLQPTELATPYLAAEQAAQAQKIGLWSVGVPAGASMLAPVAATSVPPAKIANNPVPPAPSELKPESVIVGDKSLAAAAASENPLADAMKPVTVVSLGPGASAGTGKVPGQAEKAQSTLPPSNWTLPVDDTKPVVVADDNKTGFFARYQLLITGVVMLITAFGILTTITLNRRRERLDEMKAIGAALRGELQAARAVCQARLKSWTAETDDRNVAWPRIRTSLYQAYVGRLGWLGATLARQIASIYGQASDYSTYYNTFGNDETQQDLPSKRQALQMLIQHIEEVLPHLAAIEQSGALPKHGYFTRIQDYQVSSTPPDAPPPEEPGSTTGGTNTTSSSPAGSTTPPATPSSAASSSMGPSPEAIRASAEMAMSALAPLWGKVRRLAESLPDRALRSMSGGNPDAQMPDYTLSIEEEIANLSFEDPNAAENAASADNMTKLRGTGT